MQKSDRVEKIVKKVDQYVKQTARDNVLRTMEEEEGKYEETDQEYGVYLDDAAPRGGGESPDLFCMAGNIGPLA